MRFTDLVRLSLSALWQQKLRALLTTLGVIFGAFVLVFSLSLGQGVQSTIDRESHRNLFLRKIEVHPHWGGSEEDIPKEELQVQGEMSDEKRQRIRAALVEQKLQFSARGPGIALTAERLKTMRNLEHVSSVTPVIRQQGWAVLGQRTQMVWTCSADPDNAFHRQRIIAGEFFRSPDERSVVLSEFLCYLLGATSDAEVQGLIGKKLRLEFRQESGLSGLNVYLFKGDGHVLTRQETLAVEKVRQQLPGALEQFDLTPDDKEVLRGAIQGPRRSAKVFQEDFTIAGIVRMPNGTDQEIPWDSLNRNADVLIPRQTAEEMFFRQSEGADVGVEQATILVDREENVQAVLQRVLEMKLQAYAPIEFVEQQRFIYLLIFSTMACVAAVALLVAALGITNTMLMSVLERTREIGIFKAVGAGDGTVQLIFLIEGAFIGLIGGGMGLLLGWAVSFPADAWVRSIVSRDLKIELKESLFVFPWWLSVGVVLFAVVVTTLAAVFPARHAARVNPVTALRNE